MVDRLPILKVKRNLFEIDVHPEKLADCHSAPCWRRVESVTMGFAGTIILPSEECWDDLARQIHTEAVAGFLCCEFTI